MLSLNGVPNLLGEPPELLTVGSALEISAEFILNMGTNKANNVIRTLILGGL